MPHPALGMLVSMERTHSAECCTSLSSLRLVGAWVTGGFRACHWRALKGCIMAKDPASCPSKLTEDVPASAALVLAGMGRGRRVEAILSEFPEPSASQLIVRVSGTPGSNLLRVEDASGCEVTVRLPSKTKNTIWVRTGGFLIINVTTDVEEYGDVAHFLYKDQIRYLQTRGLWPAGFAIGDRSDMHREAVRKLAL